MSRKHRLRKTWWRKATGQGNSTTPDSGDERP